MRETSTSQVGERMVALLGFSLALETTKRRGAILNRTGEEQEILHSLVLEEQQPCNDDGMQKVDFLLVIKVGDAALQGERNLILEEDNCLLLLLSA